jgi:hypothetical protein
VAWRLLWYEGKPLSWNDSREAEGDGPVVGLVLSRGQRPDFVNLWISESISVPLCEAGGVRPVVGVFVLCRGNGPMSELLLACRSNSGRWIR